MTVENYFMDKNSPKRHVKTAQVPLRNLFKKKSGEKEPFFFTTRRFTSNNPNSKC